MIFSKKHSVNFKKRTYILIVGILVLYFLAYKFAVRETFSLRSTRRELAKSIERLEEAPRRITYLEQSLDQLKNLLGQYYGESTDIQEDILNDLTVYCQKNKLIIRKVPSTHTTNKMGYQLETCQVIVQGRFIGLLKLLHHLESEFYHGQLFSASFTRQIDLKTKRKYLLLKIFIQNIKQV